MRIRESLLDELDLPGAVSAEVERGILEIPEQALDLSLANSEVQQRVAALVAASLLDGTDDQPADHIESSKPGGGFRTLELLPFASRVLYRALAEWALSRQPALKRTYERWIQMKDGPLELDSTRYVVTADIASFYQYVDHDLLRTELVSQMGGATVAATLGEFLHGVMGRRFGLPQLSMASDVFSELVIDIMERRLLRKGVAIWRYNDDFRLAAASWREAQEGLAELVREARAIGLTLNDSKTFTRARDTYERWIGSSDRTWNAIEGAVNFDFQQARLELYSDDLPELTAADLSLEASDRALDLWADPVARDQLAQEGSIHVLRELLAISLVLMGAEHDTRALRVCRQALATERSVTEEIASYLTQVILIDQTLEELQEWLVDEELFLTPWQELWILTPLLAAPTLTKELREWVASRTADSLPGIVRARAALVLARHQAVDASLVASLVEEVHPASNSDAVAALALICSDSDPILRAEIRENPLHRMIVEGTRSRSWT